MINYKTINGYYNIINTKDLKSGLYFIKMNLNNKSIYLEKLIIL